MENTASSRQLFQISNLLKYTFVIVPIVAGADKFLNLLTDWPQYLSPGLTDLLPFSAGVFMMIIGVIEIAAGLIVLKKPELGGMIVAAWLVLIALSLLIGFHFTDVAVRDLVMAIAAFSMAKLSMVTK
ncbi:MAG: hypothetical protein H3C39_01400 [Flavobacteriia bacterium]|nr:hypothetical protein [Flavobacteriia bacterium]